MSPLIMLARMAHESALWEQVRTIDQDPGPTGVDD
jgi:hypothetical protein